MAEDIEALRARVVEAARRAATTGHPQPITDTLIAHEALRRAVAELEAAEEAAKKPKLTKVADFLFRRGWGPKHPANVLIESRDAEWIEQARRLPRVDDGKIHPLVTISRDGVQFNLTECIRLSDLESLLPGDDTNNTGGPP